MLDLTLEKFLSHIVNMECFQTTAWNLQGELVSVAFEDNEDQACKSNSMGEHMFCVTYGLSKG